MKPPPRADTFQGRFSGTWLDPFAVKARAPLRPRLRYQRSYSPRTVGGKVMTPADLRWLHKYMLEIQKVSAISDEMGTVVESEWPELAHKLPSKKRR